MWRGVREKIHINFTMLGFEVEGEKKKCLKWADRDCNI